ncbi:uncharacterized protein UBRO_12877 [Ustilago bromivora]|uniref:Retrotransposon nucleocapsid protein n=1 Tax=Ustilago bromivora TaxID=307758 RepID=A0A1K0H3W5_9BASI|nr:uncharacterized protein UBRO_12877 [Ustilago bromivora]
MILNWGKDAMAWFFYQGLKENVKDNLSCSVKPTKLEALIQRSLKIDNCITEWISEKKRMSNQLAKTMLVTASNPSVAPTVTRPSTPPVPRATPHIPLTMAGKLDPDEYKCHQESNLCIYCTYPEHVVTACPVIKSKN